MCSDVPPPSSSEAFPKRRGPNASLHCTLYRDLLRGCKAAPLALGSISRCLQQAAGSPAQQGSSRHQFQKLFIPRSHGCVRRDASPLPLRDKVPKGYAFAKTYGGKIPVTQTTPNHVHAWGSVSSPPMGLMARTEAVLAPAVCHGLWLAVTVTQGNSTSGLGLLSTTFSRCSPAIGLNRPKNTFPPKGMILPSSSPAACSQCPPLAGAADPAVAQGVGARR